MKSNRLQLNDEKIAEAVNLLKGADGVEVKLIVADSDQRSAITVLDMDVLDAEFRQVVFFDTPDLKLSRGGVVLRARRIRKGGDAVVKLRPVVPSSIPDKLRRAGGFSIEVDVMPGSFVCSASLKSKADNREVKDVLLGKKRIRKLFLPEQRSFYKEHAPRGVDLESLSPFGPINVAKLKFSPDKLGGRAVVAEAWFYPDGSRLLELSTKCANDDAFQLLAEAREFLTRSGISLSSAQETKTRKALQYFSRLHTRKQR